MPVHYVVVFIPKGVIRYPERALRHAKHLAMRSLIPLIQRGFEVYEKPYHHAIKIWKEAKEQSDSYRVLGRDDYFIPICKVEKYLRKDHHDMVFNTTALYGNTEVKRVYKWKEGTIGPLNRLENIAGARLRFLAMTRYPFPRPEVIQDRWIQKSGKEDTKRTYVYGKTKGKTTVVIAHPFLPELDFADLLRGHLVELCRQCFIYRVQLSAARYYIDLLLIRLRPYLDRLYVSSIIPLRNRLGTGGFLEQANEILDDIIHSIRGEHGNRASYPERVTEQIRSEDEFSLKKPVLMKLLSNKKISERLKDYISDNDAANFSERIYKTTGRIGTRAHKRIAWGRCSPWSTRGIIHGGDYLAEDRSGYIHAAEVPVYGGRGKIDHGLFVRRQPAPNLRSSNQGLGSWFPSLALDLKVKSAFSFGVRGKGKPVSVDFILQKRCLTDQEWDEMIKNSPSPREERQVKSYGSGMLEEYHGTVREDLNPPPTYIPGVILTDGVDFPSKTREILSSFIYSVYKKIRQDFSGISSQTTDSTIKFPRSLFQLTSPDGRHKRPAIVTFPFEAPTDVSLDELFPLPVPLTDLYKLHPFEHRINDSNHFVLYLSVATHGSPGDSAAVIARNHHGLDFAREQANRYDCNEVAWLDLSGEYSDETHRSAILRLGYQSEEVTQFHRELEFIDLSSEINAMLFKGLPVPSVDELTRRLEHFDMIIVSGIESVRALEHHNLSGVVNTLEGHITSALSSTTKCTIWFDSPPPVATSSELYKHHQFRPLPHDSLLLAHIDEIVLNLPYPPRPGGSEVPLYDYVRGIVRVSHVHEKEINVTTIPVIPLIGWSRRFRALDLTAREKTIFQRLKRGPKTNRWLKKFRIDEFSEQMAVELFPFLRRSKSIEDGESFQKETGEVEVIRTELKDRERNKRYMGVLSRVAFDEGLCDKDSLKKISTKRKYWTPQLQIEPMRTVPLPPPESDLVFDNFQGNSAETVEIQRLQEARRVLLERVPEYSPFHRFFREFVETFTEAIQSQQRLGFTQAIISFLKGHHYTKDLWYRSAWYRNNLGNWNLPRNMRMELDKLQVQDNDILLRFGNYVVLLLAHLLQSHSFTQNELRVLWEDVRPWVTMQLGGKEAKTSIPVSEFNMNSLYKHLSLRTQSFRDAIPSKTVPLTNLRFGISVGFNKKNPGKHEWFIFERSPYDREIVAGCIRLDKSWAGRYLSSNTVTPLDELGVLAGQALAVGSVVPIMIANYAGTDVLYQGLGGETSSLDLDYRDVQWEMRGAVRFGTRYRGAPSRLRYLKIVNLGMTYPTIPLGQRLPLKRTSLVKSLFSHLGVIQGHVKSVIRAECLIGGDQEKGWIELRPAKKNEDAKVIRITYQTLDEAMSILRYPYETGLPFENLTWNPLEDIRYSLGVRELKKKVISEILRNRREV